MTTTLQTASDTLIREMFREAGLVLVRFTDRCGMLPAGSFWWVRSHVAAQLVAAQEAEYVDPA